jgi:hypothetical protein
MRPTPLEGLIQHAAALVAPDRLSGDSRDRVALYTPHFGAAPDSFEVPFHVFVFHADLPCRRVLRYRDVSLDPAEVDYWSVIRTFVAAVRAWYPAVPIYFVTAAGSNIQGLPNDPRLFRIDLPLDRERLMLERVIAMTAYVHSPAFVADTLFLDSDAMLNGKIASYLDGDYDVAVTVRGAAGLMPVNEGVIVARRTRIDAVQTFFRRYLATYDVLCHDESVVDYYGDIRVWRGGQLSLNAIVNPASPYSHYRDMSIDGVIVRALPCSVFNFSCDPGEATSTADAHRLIIHWKGRRKIALHGRSHHPDRGGAAGG